MRNYLKNKQGFTLIELVIVLAIAALILAGVLVAVTGAQKARRDTQRKDDMGKIASYLEQYASNHGGDYPNSSATLSTFVSTYVTGNNLKDPSAGTYTMSYTSPAAPGSLATINYQVNFTCPSGGGAAVSGGGNRRYAMTTTLESGDIYCTGN